MLGLGLVVVMDVLGTQLKKAAGESCSHLTYSDPFVSSYLSEAPNDFTNSLPAGGERLEEVLGPRRGRRPRDDRQQPAVPRLPLG